MVLVKAIDDSEKGFLPTTEALEAMGKFNEELVKAGIVFVADGLKPSCPGTAFGIPRMDRHKDGH